jgi:hypothetical protein
VTRFLGNG